MPRTGCFRRRDSILPHRDSANLEYELCGNASVEWYDCVNGEKTDPDYHSAIWVPVKRKE